MSISSNSVIHYTNKLENLKGILMNEGFRLKYCLETLNINYKVELSTAVPMVSFCDIPLSEVKNHIDSYGSYAIGLYKNWAKQNGLNPVLYLEKNSYISTSIARLIDRLLELKSDPKTDKILKVEILKLLLYCKNYEGYLKHGKIDDENYRFYNEREWRYVPKDEILIEKKAKPLIWGDTFLKEKDKNNETLKDIYCSFSPQDISYIIVDDENDIPEILTTLNEVYEDKCTTKELKVLSTRIITKNQIYNDF
ncbi:abortive infection system antitoxin AbiGi family protein [Flavobacterium mekongense]|uniref:abortive infection system antitoxin AbiGi family protein n=1 Tax=Flavobacterium mekongense TaxID=3379707 RepID=UPI0039996421